MMLVVLGMAIPVARVPSWVLLGPRRRGRSVSNWWVPEMATADSVSHEKGQRMAATGTIGQANARARFL